MRRVSIVALAFAAMALPGCMGLPRVYLHEFEGSVKKPVLFAVEDGRREEWVRVNVKRNDQSWMSPDYDLLLIRSTSGTLPPAEGDPPLLDSEKQLQDVAFIQRLLGGEWDWRNPVLIADALRGVRAPRPWNRGYLVALRPVIVAYPVDLMRPSTASAGWTSGLFFVTAAELPLLVDSLQIRDVEGGVLVTDLARPMTVNEVIDLLGSPAGMEKTRADARPVTTEFGRPWKDE